MSCPSTAPSGFVNQFARCPAKPVTVVVHQATNTVLLVAVVGVLVLLAFAVGVWLARQR